MPSKGQDKVVWASVVRPAVAGLGGVVCLACGLAAWQWAAPLSAPMLFPFAETWYAKSTAAVQPAEGIADAQKAVKLAPASGQYWMLLAYQYSRADHAMSPRAIAAIRQSYAVAPLAPTVTDYRLELIFSTWTVLPQDIRDLAQYEAEQYATTDLGRTFLHKTVPSITDTRERLLFKVICFAAEAQNRADIENSTKNQ